MATGARAAASVTAATLRTSSADENSFIGTPPAQTYETYETSATNGCRLSFADPERRRERASSWPADPIQFRAFRTYQKRSAPEGAGLETLPALYLRLLSPAAASRARSSLSPCRFGLSSVSGASVRRDAFLAFVSVT